MKILLIIDRIFPTDHAFLESVYSRILPENGYTIVCLARTLEFKSNKTEKWNNIEVHLFSISRKPSFFWKRFQRILIFCKAISLSKRTKFDIVQVRNWEFGGLVAIVVKKLYGVKFIFQRSFPTNENHISDINSGNLPFRQYIKKKLLLIIYTYILNNADVIFAISKEMKQKMIEQGFSKDKIYSIGLAFDPLVKLVSTTTLNNLKNELNIDNQNVILYLGKMDIKRNIEFIIDVFNLVSKKLENSVLILLGGSTKDIERLTLYAKNKNIVNKIRFVGWVPRGIVPQYLSISNISLSPIPPIERFIVASPTKLFESMGQGIPVVGNNLPEQKRILSESQGGICVNYDKQEFINAISFLIENPDERDRMASSARKYILSNHTYDIIADRIDNMYRNCLQIG